MSRTQVRTQQIEDGGVTIDDLNIATSGKAVITKIIQGTGINISSTGADSGTGAVTVNAPVMVASGGSHAAGLVPDPPSSSGTVKFLREDASWAVPSTGSRVNWALR